MSQSATMDLLRVAADMRAMGDHAAAEQVLAEVAPDHLWLRRHIPLASIAAIDNALKRYYNSGALRAMSLRTHPLLNLLGRPANENGGSRSSAGS